MLFSQKMKLVLVPKFFYYRFRYIKADDSAKFVLSDEKQMADKISLKCLTKPIFTVTSTWTTVLEENIDLTGFGF